MRFVSIFLLLLLFASMAACFGPSVQQRSYYVLHGVAASVRGTRPIEGLVRVRNLDAESIYEKFQIVVRRSPYELTYSDTNVWAVKPNQMVSDVIARALADSRRFTSVARELGELRPDYILSGSLHAIEVYDSGDLWYAHLGLTLRLTRFSTGETLLTFNFEERKPVPTQTFSHAARAMSELLSTAMDELILALERSQRPGPATVERERLQPPHGDTPQGSSRGEEPNETPTPDSEAIPAAAPLDEEASPQSRAPAGKHPPHAIFVPEEGTEEEPD